MEKVFILIENGAVQSIIATGETRVYICDRDNGDILPALYAADARVNTAYFDEQAAEICDPPAWWRMPWRVFKHEENDAEIYRIMQEPQENETIRIKYDANGPGEPVVEGINLQFISPATIISYFDLPDDVRDKYEQTIRPAEE